MGTDRLTETRKCHVAEEDGDTEVKDMAEMDRGRGSQRQRLA